MPKLVGTSDGSTFIDRLKRNNEEIERVRMAKLQMPKSQQPILTMIHNMEDHQSRTLWMGEIDGGVAKSLLLSSFHPDMVLSVGVKRNKLTGQPGYGYVEFVSRGVAERVLQTYNGILIPGTQQIFNLRRAKFCMRDFDAGYGHSIFIGNLAPDVTDCLLKETFRAKYLSTGAAKVVVNPQTRQSKGFGFVKFMSEVERDRAMSEMNGVFCSSRPMRISSAVRKGAGVQQTNTAADK
ncbi:hypothetical protein GIB67_037943, partial [Kingdonia uniflora]